MVRNASRSRHGAGRSTIRRAMKPPYHVVKLGPMDTDEGPGSMYIAISDDDLLEPVVGENDADGLRAVIERHGSGPRTCDDELLEAGEALGFTEGEPPEWALHAIAVIATRMHNAASVAADVTIEPWEDVLDAVSIYSANAPWGAWNDSDVLSLEFTVDGGMPELFEAAVLGAAGEVFGLALYPGRGGAARAEAAAATGDLEQIKQVATVALTLDEDPTWAAIAVENAIGAPFAPHLYAQDAGGERPATALDLHRHAAAMAAVSVVTPWVPEVELVRVFPDGPRIRVRARVVEKL